MLHTIHLCNGAYSSSEASSKAKIEECIYFLQVKKPGSSYLYKLATDSWPSKYDVLALKFREAVHLYSSIVPLVLVTEVRQDIIKILEKLARSGEKCSKSSNCPSGKL